MGASKDIRLLAIEAQFESVGSWIETMQTMNAVVTGNAQESEESVWKAEWK